MARYFLPRHVHFCGRGDVFVFLDLKRDDYTLINGETAIALQALLSSGEEKHDALKELLEEGLLTTDGLAGRTVVATDMDLAVEPLVDADEPVPTSVNFFHIVHFVTACLTAAVKLRWQHIERVVASVERRKFHHAHLKRDWNARARELTGVFQRLRYFFPFDYLCLYDSLALVEFLARYRIFPTWVFGIRLDPWTAHCWVQDGRFTFNEGVEEAAGYTPIMAI